MGHISYSEPSSSEANLDYGSQGEFRASSYPPEASSYPPRSSGVGIPYKCKCGLSPITQTSTTERNPGRVFYGCRNSKDGLRHSFKWLDEALMEEIEEIRNATHKQGECIRQMEDWYNYQEFPTIKVLEKEISEIKALLLQHRCGVSPVMGKGKDWNSMIAAGLILLVGIIYMLFYLLS